MHMCKSTVHPLNFLSRHGFHPSPHVTSSPQVGWLKVESQTILSLHTRTVTTNRRVSVTHDQQRGWSLHVRRVQPADQGCYMCQINTAQMKKQVGCVTVQGRQLVGADVVNL